MTAGLAAVCRKFNAGRTLPKLRVIADRAPAGDDVVRGPPSGIGPASAMPHDGYAPVCEDMDRLLGAAGWLAKI